MDGDIAALARAGEGRYLSRYSSDRVGHPTDVVIISCDSGAIRPDMSLGSDHRAAPERHTTQAHHLSHTTGMASKSIRTVLSTSTPALLGHPSSSRGSSRLSHWRILVSRAER